MLFGGDGSDLYLAGEREGKERDRGRSVGARRSVQNGCAELAGFIVLVVQG